MLRAELNDRWGGFWGFQPPEASRMQFVWPATFKREMVPVCIFFAFDRSNHLRDSSRYWW
ncbi:hypothetical protein A9502_30145 [Klebsiella pneumoniae]|nr:hypothetical protein A9502_30145 [Klebsiella pneumoniae]